MNIGFLGTGLMGSLMADRLLHAKFSVAVYNRTKEKTAQLARDGARIAHTPAEAISTADCIVTMLSDAAVVRKMLLSPEVKPLLKGKTVIQMSTISPTESVDLMNKIVSLGASYLEAPVLGSTLEARYGRLTVMVGADDITLFAKWERFLENFGVRPMYIGDVGQASGLKLALNQLIASHIAAFSASLGYAQKLGIETEQFMNILTSSSLYAPMFDKKLQRILKRNFSGANFPAKHLTKDLRLFLREAKKKGIDATGVRALERLMKKTVNLGYGEDDYSAIFATISPIEPQE